MDTKGNQALAFWKHLAFPALGFVVGMLSCDRLCYHLTERFAAERMVSLSVMCILSFILLVVLGWRGSLRSRLSGFHTTLAALWVAFLLGWWTTQGYEWANYGETVFIMFWPGCAGIGTAAVLWSHYQVAVLGIRLPGARRESGQQDGRQ